MIDRSGAGLGQARWWIVCLCCVPVQAQTQVEGAQVEKSRQMIQQVREMAKQVGISADGTGELSEQTLRAMERVPRHKFVPPDYARRSYHNRPLPIGHGQTISQPYIVALMTDLAQLRPDARVLEVGTGSGYQAAVLAELAAQVYSVEIIEELGQKAARSLKALGYQNVQVRVGDGYLGWREQAPFDGILVTAAADHVPEPLLRQLAPGGRLVMPLGEQGRVQTLLLVEKTASGDLLRRELLPVSFVPLTGAGTADPE